MIVKFSSGRSFRGLVVQYLMHDAGHAVSSERVAFSHTFGLANDHVPSAVHEMVMTARDAELLKIEAGVRGGSTPVAKPVKHVTLAWHVSEKVDRASMIVAAEGFMRGMGWHEHQAILIAHKDTAHPHIHLVVNCVHPETGRKLNDSLEQRRAQKWALSYERERGQIFCQQRVNAAVERVPSPPRPVWQLLEKSRKAALDAEVARLAGAPEAHEARVNAASAEWQVLRELQMEERIGFMAEGKTAYRAVREATYHEVRHAMRGDWAGLFVAKRAGTDRHALQEMKAELVARQHQAIAAHQHEALAALRAERDAAYRALLNQQKENRAALTGRQEQGLTSTALLARMATEGERKAEPPAIVPAAVPNGTGARYGDRPPAPLRWTDRQGMAQQQRSAMHWLDSVERRAKRAAAYAEPEQPRPGGQNAPAARRNREILDRVYARKGKPAPEPGYGAGKDDCGMEAGPD